MKNEMLLKIMVGIMLMTTFLIIGSIPAVLTIAQKSNAIDLTEYDAESKITAFIPFADSGLKNTKINQYPQKELIVPYDSYGTVYDSNARVYFKIGEWKFLGGDNNTREEYDLGNSSKLIKSEFWFETDLISWTDLEYEDVFSEENIPFEVEKQYQWLYLNKRHNFGWDPGSFNSLTRISAWNDDLYNIYMKIGSTPSDNALTSYINPWPFNIGRPYWNLYGLKQLLKNPLNYMPQHYNKYLKWNQLNFPGNPTNIRDFSLNRFNELKLSGDLFFEVDLKESFWNQLKFADLIEVRDNQTSEPIGEYHQNQIVYSIDSAYTIGPNDPNHPESRTRVVDLQELYDSYSNISYSPHSLEGNMLSSTNNNEPKNCTSNALDSISSFKDTDYITSIIPQDVIGDGKTILSIVDKTAQWSWDKYFISQGPFAQLPGSQAIEPLIWEHEKRPITVSIQDIYDLKPLDVITLQNLYFDYNIKDRSSAVFKTHFSYGPQLEIHYATLNLQEIHLTIENGFWGGYNYYPMVTGIDDLVHVPYSANIRNIGFCQTLKLKVIVLTTYDYEPYASLNDDDISPDFPLDDTTIIWPDNVDTGGDITFTAWEEQYDLIDDILGKILEFFNSFWWLIIIGGIVLIAVAIVVLKVLKKWLLGSISHRNLSILKKITNLGLNLSTGGLTSKLINTVNHIEGVKISITLKVMLITMTFFCFFLSVVIYILLI